VPTLWTKPVDRRWLFALERSLGPEPAFIVFDFSHCKVLHQRAVAFLGGLARLIESKGGRVTFDWPTCNQTVLRTVQQCGFSEAFGGPSMQLGTHAIPYRQDLVQGGDAIVDYLQESWLGRGWPRAANGMRNAYARACSICRVTDF
jgi:hypothetical protein